MIEMKVRVATRATDVATEELDANSISQRDCGGVALRADHSDGKNSYSAPTHTDRGWMPLTGVTPHAKGYRTMFRRNAFELSAAMLSSNAGFWLRFNFTFSREPPLTYPAYVDVAGGVSVTVSVTTGVSVAGAGLSALSPLWAEASMAGWVGSPSLAWYMGRWR